jgi:hypothetical protein
MLSDRQNCHIFDILRFWRLFLTFNLRVAFWEKYVPTSGNENIFGFGGKLRAAVKRLQFSLLYAPMRQRSADHPRQMDWVSPSVMIFVILRSALGHPRNQNSIIWRCAHCVR